jgi:hypothetical protein
VSAAAPTVTEFFPGAYRVTRCDAEGRPQRAMTVARISTPGGFQPWAPISIQVPESTTYMLYGDPSEPVWAKVWLDHGSETTKRVMAPSAPMPADLDRPAPPVGGDTDGALRSLSSRAPVAHAAADDTCTRSDYAWSNTWWTRTYSYAINEFTMTTAFRDAVIKGHQNWDNTYNSCGYGDQNNINSVYAGHVNLAASSSPDGQSMIDMGTLTGACSGALACTWAFPYAVVGNQIGEADMRFQTGYPWVFGVVANSYDVESVATHESGHMIGLEHMNTSSNLTMYYSQCGGCLKNRTLARGDVLGMRAIYP